MPTFVSLLVAVSVGLAPAAPRSDVALSAHGEVIPADQVEEGPCALRLSVSDAVTGAAMESTIRLWRLDAPGNETWGPGDQCQREVKVPVDGHTIEGLAAGRYRAVAFAARVGSDDDEGFVVGGPMTDVTLAIESPGERPAWLELYDVDGVRIERARLRVSSSTRRRKAPAAPDWVEPRELIRVPDDPLFSGGSGGFATSRGCGGAPPPIVTAGPDGFDLGTFPNDSKGEKRSVSVHVDVEGTASTWVDVEGADKGQRRYVGVAIDPASVVPRIVRDDGDPVDPALLWIRCRPILASAAKTDTPWLEVPIEVEIRTLEKDRFEPFEFTYTLGDEAQELHVLTPR